MRLIDADAIESHEQFDPLVNGQYEYVRVAFMVDIDELPTIDPQPQWIPCSEKLPENDDSVLISLKDGRVFEGAWSDDADFPIWSACYGESSAYPKEVLAWMPLPEPWKGEEE